MAAPAAGGGDDGALRVTIIGLGNLMEIIWPVIGRAVGGDDVASRVIGVTADEADLARKEAVFGFQVVLEDNLGALTRNRPDIILFAPPPTVAPELIESALGPHYEARRIAGDPLPDLYAFPPMPPGSTYLDALGHDVLVVNLIPNNVTTVAGRPVVDEGYYVRTFASPWPPDRGARLERLFAGQGAAVELEPKQLVPMLGGACTISSLWYAVPAVAHLLADAGTAVTHNEIGEYLRGHVRALTGFAPAVSTPVHSDLRPPRADFLAALIEGWHGGVSSYFAATDLPPDASRTLVERGLDLTLHTIQVESRHVLHDHAVGAATKGGVLERAIRSVEQDLWPAIEEGLARGIDVTWSERFAALVQATAEKVRAHGMTLADD